MTNSVTLTYNNGISQKLNRRNTIPQIQREFFISGKTATGLIIESVTIEKL